MKRLVSLLVTVVLTISIFLGAAPQKTEAAAYRVVIYDTAGEGLAMKSLPDINSRRYLYLYDGTEITVEEESGSWGRIFYAGAEGWIYLRYTRIVGSYQAPEPTYGYISPAYYQVYNTGSEGLELRCQPSTEVSTFGPMPDESTVLVTAIQGSWAYTYYNGTYGWAHTNYLRYVSSAPESAVPKGDTLKKVESDASVMTGESDEELEEDAIPYIYSASIADYKGVTYSLENIGLGSDADPVEAARIQKLDIPVPEYDYNMKFAIYQGKVYFTCKESGTSDYETALYCCDLDGSNMEKIAGNAETNARFNFYIREGVLYVMGTTYSYNIEENRTQWLSTETDSNSKTSLYNQKYEFSYGSTSISMEEYHVTGLGIATENHQVIVSQFPGYGIFCLTAATADSLYYEYLDGNYAYLYRYDIETGQSFYVDRQFAAGGGLYFNY